MVERRLIEMASLHRKRETQTSGYPNPPPEYEGNLTFSKSTLTRAVQEASCNFGHGYNFDFVLSVMSEILPSAVLQRIKIPIFRFE